MPTKNTRLFHIHKKNHHSSEWYLGNKISTPQDNNYFTQGLLNRYVDNVSSNFNEYKLMEYWDSQNFSDIEEYKHKVCNPELTEVIVDPLELKGYIEMLLCLLNKTFKEVEHAHKMIREMIFEECRKENFSNLPSRQRCIWLTDKHNLYKWCSERSFDKKNYALFEVIATGKFHEVDEGHIVLDINRYSDYYRLAAKYWQGLPSDNGRNMIEILFEGELEIIAEYFSIEEIN